LPAFAIILVLAQAATCLLQVAAGRKRESELLEVQTDHYGGYALERPEYPKSQFTSIIDLINFFNNGSPGKLGWAYYSPDLPTR